MSRVFWNELFFARIITKSQYNVAWIDQFLTSFKYYESLALLLESHDLFLDATHGLQTKNSSLRSLAGASTKSHTILPDYNATKVWNDDTYILFWDSLNYSVITWHIIFLSRWCFGPAWILKSIERNPRDAADTDGVRGLVNVSSASVFEWGHGHIGSYYVTTWSIFKCDFELVVKLYETWRTGF